MAGPATMYRPIIRSYQLTCIEEPQQARKGPRIHTWRIVSWSLHTIQYMALTFDIN
ncbi:hypothetical protein VJ786_02495 [Sphingobacterium sp. PU5-4]|uniref:Uncharacterized protein n=1 Tax=Sphingobacterium tenebrionis TaxID=3111775 RepID=A0ABU8I2Z3_9SPHI